MFIFDFKSESEDLLLDSMQSFLEFMLARLPGHSLMIKFLRYAF